MRARRSTPFFASMVLLAFALRAVAADHVAPHPPASTPPPMSAAQMTSMMAMDDTSSTGKLMLDQLEWRDHSGDSQLGWQGTAWYGNDYDKVWLRAEGEAEHGSAHSRIELSWNRIVSRWWSTQLGVRADVGAGPGRGWLAAGIEGLAPYSFEVEATAYIGDSGRTALLIEATHDLLFTQRLILQPRAELQAYGRSDPERALGSGLAEARLGLRLRYELRREFAPYLGVEWQTQTGRTADYTRAAGRDPDELQVVVGLRAWL